MPIQTITACPPPFRTIYIFNSSLDIAITTVEVNGINATVVAGILPNTTGNNTQLSTAVTGTANINCYLQFTPIYGQQITCYDSNLVSQCASTDGGFSVTFYNVVINNNQPVQIYATDGICTPP